MKNSSWMTRCHFEFVSYKKNCVIHEHTLKHLDLTIKLILFSYWSEKNYIKWTAALFYFFKCTFSIIYPRSKYICFGCKTYGLGCRGSSLKWLFLAFSVSPPHKSPAFVKAKTHTDAVRLVSKFPPPLFSMYKPTTVAARCAYMHRGTPPFYIRPFYTTQLP